MEASMREVARKVTNQLDMEDAKFRSVYLPIVRDEEPRSLEVFDFADASAITGTRESSNTANQALYMMNNPFVIQQSSSFASRDRARSSKTQSTRSSMRLYLPLVVRLHRANGPRRRRSFEGLLRHRPVTDREAMKRSPRFVRVCSPQPNFVTSISK